MKKILITGNVGKEPELRSTQDGNKFATFSVAVSVGSKQAPKTDWVEISCGGKLADVVCTYLKKGSKILVSGFPTVNAYINKDNVAVGTLRVYADDIEFLSAKNESEQGGGYIPTQTNSRDLTNNDIPF
jgi:single-strand DNA-binding protein